MLSLIFVHVYQNLKKEHRSKILVHADSDPSDSPPSRTGSVSSVSAEEATRDEFSSPEVYVFILLTFSSV